MGLITGFSSLSSETVNLGPLTIFQDKLLTGTYCDETGDYAMTKDLTPRLLTFFMLNSAEHEISNAQIY